MSRSTKWPFLFFIFPLFCFPAKAAAPRIAIIGTGAVTPIGETVDAFWKSLQGERSGIGKITSFDASDIYPPNVAAEVPLSNKEIAGSLFSCRLLIQEERKRTDRQSLFAIRAAAEAMDEAHLFSQEPSSLHWQLRTSAQKIGAILGSTLGGVPEMEEDPGLRSLMTLLPKSPRHVATALGIRGLSTSVAAACASGLQAMILGSWALLADDAEFMLTGATDSQISHPMGLRIRQTILSPTGKCRSFDKNADGTVLGEGAGMAVLTRESKAKEMGIPIQAFVAGWAAEAHGHLSRLDSHLVAAVMRRAIDKAGIQVQDIGAVFAHAPGTFEGDLAELSAIGSVFGNAVRKIPIVSLSPRLGHPLGPSGILRVIAAIKALRHQFLPGNLNLEKVHPGFEAFQFVDPKGMHLKGARYILINSYGLTGHYASVVIEAAS